MSAAFAGEDGDDHDGCCRQNQQDPGEDAVGVAGLGDDAVAEVVPGVGKGSGACCVAFDGAGAAGFGYLVAGVAAFGNGVFNACGQLFWQSCSRCASE